MPRAPKPFEKPATRYQRLKPEPPKIDHWLTLQDAAGVMGVSTDMLRRALKRRELAYTKAGESSASLVRIPVSALEEWRKNYWVEFPSV